MRNCYPSCPLPWCILLQDLHPNGNTPCNLVSHKSASSAEKAKSQVKKRAAQVVCFGCCRVVLPECPISINIRLLQVIVSDDDDDAQENDDFKPNKKGTFDNPVLYIHVAGMQA